MSLSTFVGMYVAFRLLDMIAAIAWNAMRNAWYRWYYRHSPYKGWGGSVHIGPGRRAESVPGAKDGAIFLLHPNGEVAAQFGDLSRKPFDTETWKPKNWWGGT